MAVGSSVVAVDMVFLLAVGAASWPAKTTKSPMTAQPLRAVSRRRAMGVPNITNGMLGEGRGQLVCHRFKLFCRFFGGLPRGRGFGRSVRAATRRRRPPRGRQRSVHTSRALPAGNETRLLPEPRVPAREGRGAGRFPGALGLLAQGRRGFAGATGGHTAAARVARSGAARTRRPSRSGLPGTPS